MKELLKKIRVSFASLLRLDDAAEEKDVIAGVEQSVEFCGAMLWVLVLAMFVASLGLNTNSAAVIIGAMLISPLMGPIIGMGIGVGIYDFDLLRRSWKNFVVATALMPPLCTVGFGLATAN